jgi:hypothetical protein
MPPTVELFRGSNYIRCGELPLIPLLRSVFEPLLDTPLDGANFRLILMPVDDSRVLQGSLSVVNLRPSHGYVKVYINRDGELIYQHPHPVRELFGPQLQKILAEREPTETHWGFAISGRDLDEVPLVMPTSQIAHGAGVRSRARSGALFHIEEIMEREPPESKSV